MEIMGYTISMSIIWLAIAVIFAIIEGLTMGLTTIWFAGGALVALITALIGVPLPVQIIVFFIVSALLLVFTRSLFVKKLHTGQEKTNVDALIGKEAIVLDSIAPFQPGRIKLNGQVWTAISGEDNQSIKTGETVTVTRIEGVKAIVSPLNK